MRLVLALALVLSATPTSAAPTRKPCVVPRLYTLSMGAARLAIARSGCTLGGISYEKPRAAVVVVTDQVPVPGAILPAAFGRVFLIVA